MSLRINKKFANLGLVPASSRQLQSHRQVAPGVPRTILLGNLFVRGMRQAQSPNTIAVN
jgi:hypothetical protein